MIPFLTSTARFWSALQQHSSQHEKLSVVASHVFFTKHGKLSVVVFACKVSSQWALTTASACRQLSSTGGSSTGDESTCRQQQRQCRGVRVPAGGSWP